jgi:hypothetical protein
VYGWALRVCVYLIRRTDNLLLFSASSIRLVVCLISYRYFSTKEKNKQKKIIQLHLFSKAPFINDANMQNGAYFFTPLIKHNYLSTYKLDSKLKCIKLHEETINYQD